MLKKTITALSLLCILAACQSDDNSSPQPKPRKDIALTRAEQEMMDLGTDFAFRFFNQVCKTEVEKPRTSVISDSVFPNAPLAIIDRQSEALKGEMNRLGFSTSVLQT